ncbi:AAA family ATPase [Spirochaeta isovalerica]|uniref:Wobble nucleotide-excising tRNase n=1 Tax=Spirochaeta isovalerica TaxID=150 RepID=A0A841REW3_9SPIO|nr:AAA family ATPase [Spirochaeta isovalerica]MBB6481540.1 wobble nucleotide-excising tRNase [Spirochaeta isovalerica]
MAVFKDFQWSQSVRDQGNNVDEFKKINIIYGRNYSGKTTLSRILRALETGSISEKYNSPEFDISFMNGNHVTKKDVGSGQLIRVFNDDFIKDNLRFIIDDEKDINSFAILGEDNAKLEEEIADKEASLGKLEEKSGIIGKLISAEIDYHSAQKAHSDKTAELEQKLRDKANKTGTGIKHNKSFGDANYNVTKIKADIASVSLDSYNPISDEQITTFYELLREEPKDEVIESTEFDLKYDEITEKAKRLIEKKIMASDPIQELLNDAALASWVRSGREKHQGKRDRCAFCGNIIPPNLWNKLDKHFNKESEELRQALDNVLKEITTEQKRTSTLLDIKDSEFYSQFSDKLDLLKEDFSNTFTLYINSLESVKEQVNKRKDDIFFPLTFEEPGSVADDLNVLRSQYEKIREKSNKLTENLSSNQKKARSALRLNEVHTFLEDIHYANECSAIESLQQVVTDAETKKNQIKEDVDFKKAEIKDLKAQLKDESKGAERVNDFLNNYFGHQFLSLKAIEETSGDATTGYRFEVTRNSEKAYHLSEGECSLIAFCYFMAKLEDFETKGNQPIIWIDDPISSLDANHIFFVYSLINSNIVIPEEYSEDGEIKKRERFSQLFISTHNLDFLKYLKRLPGALNKKNSRYLIVTRVDDESTLSLMPRYLKDYVTEFNFLFHQIYKCANTDIESDESHSIFYNFGNNARKFLEAFLFYKFPNAVEKDDKLYRFFGRDALSSALTDRINNEYSHLEGLFERSVMPVDVPEMKSTAKFILDKINEKDPEQYEALLQSIGVEQ